MKDTGGASLALQTYRFDGTSVSSVFIISSLALFVVFLLLEKFFEMYNFGENEYFKDVNRTCSFANVLILFFVILSLLSQLGMASETNLDSLNNFWAKKGSCIPEKFEEEQCYVVDSFKQKEIPHEVLLLCAIFIFVDSTRFFIDVRSVAAFSLAIRKTFDGLRKLTPIIGLFFVAVLMTIKTVYGAENALFLNESICRSVAWIFLLRHNRLFSKNIEGKWDLIIFLFNRFFKVPD